MSKLRLEIDLQGIRDDAAALPAEIASLDEVDAAAHGLYHQTEGGAYQLDGQTRDELLGEFDKMIQAENLKAENASLRKARDRQLVTETIRSGLLKAGVKPGLLEGAVALFLQSHKCAVRERKDGSSEVVVVGKYGGSTAAEASVQFMSDQEAEAAFTDAGTPDPVTGGGAIAAAFRKLH